MVVEIGNSTGKTAICKHCDEPIEEVQWGNKITWGHTSITMNSEYCSKSPKAEPK